ncbi:MAG TPA: hypothetical protein VF066_13980 [Thermoleophilaceae bacterium]
MKVSSLVAALVTALAFSAGAYGDTGNSPNGPPGPEGNPNQPAPAATPQANGPQGPAGNEGNSAAEPQGKKQSQGKSDESHGKSQAQSHGKSDQGHGKSEAQSHPTQSHANPNVGTPRKGGREDRPADKITICHATKSHTNPYVAITISVNGLNGHGPAEDPHHHDGSWKDIIPAPNPDAKDGGCPSQVTEQVNTGKKNEHSTTTQQSTEVAKFVAATPEVAAIAPATETPQQVVLGEHVSGTTPAAAEAPAESKVLGVQASGSAPKAAVAARAADESEGTLPFTGMELVLVLLAAAAALLGGFALRRATTHSR